MNNYTLEVARTAGAKELKGGKGKANRDGNRCAFEELSSGAQDRQRTDWSGGKVPEPGRAVALRGEAKGTSRRSGRGLRSRAIGLCALSSAESAWAEMLCLCA